MTGVRTYALDLAERAGWTFVQTAAASLAGAQVTNFSELKQVAIAAGIAGGAAVLSLLKGVLAGVRTGTASTSVKVAKPYSPEHAAPDAP